MLLSDLPLNHNPVPLPTPRPPWFRLLLVLGLVGILALGGVLIWFGPGLITIPLDTSGEPTLIWQGEEITGRAVVRQKDNLYFHVPILQSLLDSNIFWDQEKGYLAITTKDQLVQMNSSQLTWFINQKPVELRFPLFMIEEEPYLDLEPLKFLYQLDIDYIPDTNRVIVRHTSTPFITGEITSAKAYLRLDNSIRSPRLGELHLGARLIIIEEIDNWLKVQTEEGLIGYLPDRQISSLEISFTPPEKQLEKPPWKPLGGKISLVWEQVTSGSKNSNPEVIPELAGINVYSPTWFHLDDSLGNIVNYSDPELVIQSHQEGKQVWALFSNSFDPEMTEQFLKNPEARDRAIRQLVIHSQLYHLDGINIDFENIPLENKELLVQFVREMAPVLREQGLVVSMDVTFKSNSGNWSLVYDRKTLGEAVDYLMVMAYDEYWASSPIPGSVASLPWVEKGIQEILQEVPAEKVVLGIPLYARLWTVSQEDGVSSVTSKALSMNQARKWLEENELQPTLDPATGQHFAQIQKDGKHYLLWLEDETSLQSRLELVHKYGLSGVASWQRRFAIEEIWPTLAGFLDLRP